MAAGVRRGGRSSPGAQHEAALAARGLRKSQGSYYTPDDVVQAVLDLSLTPVITEALSARDPLCALVDLRVIDPACGSGNFLVAAAVRLQDALIRAGMTPPAASAHVAANTIRGIDRDPEAAALCRAALASALGVEVDVVGGIIDGDALLHADLVPDGTFDLVVGNPPFLSQLGAATSRTGSEATTLRARFGPAIGSYTDPAAAFVLLALQLARPDGGRIALIEPMSFLTARDAAGARTVACEAAALTELWVLDDRVFDAAVEVCVPVLERGFAPAATRLFRGRDQAPGGLVPAPTPAASTWADLLADVRGLPQRRLRTSGVLGDIATATADFRDQFYGLAPHALDRAEADEGRFPPLITSGLIDPATLHWGNRTTRFNKVSYLHPRIDLDGLPEPLAVWARTRLVPKVLLATQTKVLEAVVDPKGRLLPSVPVVTVTPRLASPEVDTETSVDASDGTADDASHPAVADPLVLWRIGAVLTCAAVSLEAARRHLGSGRNAQAMRLRAQEVLALPLPADQAAWDHAADLLRCGAPLPEVTAVMDGAYGLVDDDELARWWLDRSPATG